MREIDISKIKLVHFIGIGGIGMSALARMFLLEGKKVTGSDTGESKVTLELKKLGVEISKGHNVSNVPENTQLVIFTIAVSDDNPELLEAKRRNIPAVTYPELLGLVSKDKYTIAVSGTHGKTTTTGMIAKILLEAKKDPTVVIGSFLTGYDSNFIAGTSELFVVEACEYKRSFLNLNPKILVITNIDNDHLDYYKDLADIQSAFQELVEKLPKDGVLVAEGTSTLIKPLIAKAPRFIDYSKVTDNFALKIPGVHNKQNASAALSVAEALNIERTKAIASLQHFEGTWRRSEYKGKTKEGVLLYDDYGHHPTEVKATLTGFRELFLGKTIHIVFQPHLYSRTKLLLSEFADALSIADSIVLTPIYAAREKDDGSVSSKTLADKLKERGKKVLVFPAFPEIAAYIRRSAIAGDVVIIMGAGDVYKLADLLL